MNPADWHGALAYLGIYLAAVVEGEVVFTFAAIMVHEGRLDGLGVYLAAALGGSTGDQFFYYLTRGVLHGHLRRLLDRFPALARRHNAIIERVRRHENVMAASTRFLPGLRVAIPVACAYARVPALTFSTLNLVGAFAWAAVVMLIVAWGGPDVLARLGLHGWWSLLMPAALILLFFRWLGSASRKLDVPDPGDGGTNTRP